MSPELIGITGSEKLWCFVMIFETDSMATDGKTSTEVAFNRVKLVGLQHIRSLSCDTSGTLERYDEMFVPINSVPNNAMI